MSENCTTNEITVFNFEAHEIRKVEMNDEPAWVGADVCEILGYANAPQAIGFLDEDEKGICRVDTLGGPQEMLVVNESGLYHLIFKSRKKEAVRFRKWVTAELLPTIRKTGQYGAVDTKTIDCRIDDVIERRIAVRLNLMEAKLAAMDLWPLGEYARSKKVIMLPKEARLIAVSLMAICRANGLRTGQTPSPMRFNTPLRTYPKSVLDAHFSTLLDRYRPLAQPLLFPVGTPAITVNAGK